MLLRWVAILAALSLYATPAVIGSASAVALEQGPPTEDRDERININEASAKELVQLPGIGPSRAEAIIAEREKRAFRRIEDILRVPGIGRKTFSRIRHAIRVR